MTRAIVDVLELLAFRTGILIRAYWGQVPTMASRTQLSGPLILILALFFGFMMTEVQFPPLPLITFLSFPLIALAILVLIAMRFRW